jgi:hypothetical protein
MEAPVPRTVRRLVTVALSAAALGITAAPASAGLLTGLLGGGGLLGSVLYVVDDLVDGLLTGRTALSAQNCPEPTLYQPFRPWGDPHQYFLVTGAHFQSVVGDWELRRAVIDGGDLNIAPGGTVVTPKFCVGDQEPSFRMMVRAPDSTARLRIDALFLGTSGELRRDRVGYLYGNKPTYRPSPIIWMGTNYRAARGEKTAIAFQFTAERGNWEIDNLFIDPFRSR